MRITARKKFWEYFKSTKTIYGRTIKGSSDIIEYLKQAVNLE